MITHKRRQSFVFTIALRITGLTGLIVSLYLLSEHYGAGPSLCSGSPTDGTKQTSSCALVNHSKFAVIFDVPVALLGVTWNIIFLLIGREISKSQVKGQPTQTNDALHPEQFIMFQLLWTGIGFFFVLYFILAEVILGAICPLCTIVHFLVVVDLYCAWRMYQLANLEIFSDIEGRLWWLKCLSKSDTVKVWVIWIATVHLIIFLGFILLPDLVSPAIDENLAECITSKGNIWMYGLSTCSVCARQKAMFKSKDIFDKYIGKYYVECGDNGEGARKCKELNVEDYPTWVKNSLTGDVSFEQTRLVGLQTAASLKQLADC
eukprot:TRINITY_DN4599_c0_g1_i1.p1 TRINITY_DN4599_c0_g1~~TRINITY_DN4599_c0_g1_i1.p1  ORF type:complete len:319 (+),score=45.32 TRINITY_DN4599_c0_g1_i1:172-1128(+)